jgi:excisionase family DNA binding protein
MSVAIATLLTLGEAAERLRKSEAQLRWMIHTGTAPRSAKIGGRRMFRASDVEDYINAAFEAESA